MKKQILFWTGMSCLMSLNVTGQNKYNDLVKNQLVGPVKEVVMTRKVYGADEGYVNATKTTSFDSKGYITRSGKDTYSYNGTYTQCNCNVYPDGTTEEHYSLTKKESTNECVYSGKFTQKFDGGGNWITSDGVINGIIFKFDESNRLLSLKQDEPMGGNLFKLLNDYCFKRKYSYRGTDALPYRVEEELDRGGDGFVYNLLISYVNIDAKGNWTHRKLYHEKTNKLLMEETRTITYFPEANKASSTQALAQQNRIPSFKGGGQEAMKKFFASNANPRKPAIATAGYGEVIVEFTVTEEGEIKDAKLKARVSVSMDEEALRLVNIMPKWNPGLIGGQPTKMKVQVGLRFLPNQAFRYIKTIIN